MDEVGEILDAKPDSGGVFKVDERSAKQRWEDAPEPPSKMALKTYQEARRKRDAKAAWEALSEPELSEPILPQAEALGEEFSRLVNTQTGRQQIESLEAQLVTAITNAHKNKQPTVTTVQFEGDQSLVDKLREQQAQARKVWQDEMGQHARDVISGKRPLTNVEENAWLTAQSPDFRGTRFDHHRKQLEELRERIQKTGGAQAYAATTDKPPTQRFIPHKLLDLSPDNLKRQNTNITEVQRSLAQGWESVPVEPVSQVTVLTPAT